MSVLILMTSKLEANREILRCSLCIIWREEGAKGGGDKVETRHCPYQLAVKSGGGEGEGGLLGNPCPQFLFCTYNMYLEPYPCWFPFRLLPLFAGRPFLIKMDLHNPNKHIECKKSKKVKIKVLRSLTLVYL
jgi:hypothetical protein